MHSCIDGEREVLACSKLVEPSRDEVPGTLSNLRSLPSPTCVLDPPIADGSPVSVAAQFFEVGLAGSTKGACFQEPGYSYEPSSHGGRHNVSTRTVELALPEDAQPGEFCCASCWAAKGCEAWTVANGICTLLVPSALAVHSDVGKRNFRRPIPKLVEATRVGVHGALSGTVIRDECYAPAS
ncbi:hypothetical protein DIPPA_23097 [Diplonema papillatum]|nr:hypothetical protein DIPPA_23097 [Diplonema papillatum]